MPKVGSIFGNEYILRCPDCGDSENQKNGHLYVNLVNGRFFCHKCGNSGMIGEGFQLEMDQLITDGKIKLRPQSWEIPEIQSGAGSSRPTRLPRYHYLDEEWDLWDAFKLYDPSTLKQVGVHTRKFGKVSKTYGERGIAWIGDELKSSEQDPLILVEGPYDVVWNNAVSTFGIPTAPLLNKLSEHHVILMPDGDVFLKTHLTWRFLKLVSKMIAGYWTGCFLEGIYLIKDGLDPDEISSLDSVIKIMGLPDMLLFMSDLRRRLKNGKE